MSNQSAVTQEDSNEFLPKSFIIFCLDDAGDIAFEMSWGETDEDIKKFAVLLNKINAGQFEKMILEQLKLQCKEKNDTKGFSVFNKAYKVNVKDLVVDPTNVELH